MRARCVTTVLIFKALGGKNYVRRNSSQLLFERLLVVRDGNLDARAEAQATKKPLPCPCHPDFGRTLRRYARPTSFPLTFSFGWAHRQGRTPPCSWQQRKPLEQTGRHVRGPVFRQLEGYLLHCAQSASPGLPQQQPERWTWGEGCRARRMNVFGCCLTSFAPSRNLSKCACCTQRTIFS